MRAYDLAWKEYHRHGVPTWSWAEVVGAHFRVGAVVALDDAFILARRVHVEDEDGFHLSPLQSRADGNCWMIWVAAGRLDSLLGVARAYSLEWVSYQRRGSSRLHRRRLSEILRRHEFTESAQNSTAADATAARFRDGAGKSIGGSGSPPAGESPLFLR